MLSKSKIKYPKSTYPLYSHLFWFRGMQKNLLDVGLPGRTQLPEPFRRARGHRHRGRLPSGRRALRERHGPPLGVGSRFLSHDWAVPSRPLLVVLRVSWGFRFPFSPLQVQLFAGDFRTAQMKNGGQVSFCWGTEGLTP